MSDISYADVIIEGTVFTGEGTVEEAMAVKDGRIVYVGDQNGVLDLAGDDTEVIRLGADEMVVPAFTEGHAHVTSTYEILYYAVLHEGESKEDYVQIMKTFLQEHPETKFLMARGYRNGAFDEQGPKAWMLDEVSTEIPIAAIGEDAHSMWVNTKALEMAGVDENTENVPGGEIIRHENGKPTGWFHEAADSLIRPILPAFELEKVKQSIMHYQNLAVEDGVLHVFEPMLNPQREYEVCVQAYEELAKENRLVLDYQVGYTIYPGDDIDAALEQMVSYQKRCEAIGNERYQFNVVKVFIDGVLEGHTAFLLEPYADCPDSCGEPLWTQERLDEVIVKSAALGFQVHIHTIGDGALAMAIHSFAEAKKAGYKVELPHIVTHVQIVDKSQFAQLADLGVAVVVNPYWHIKDTMYFDKLEKPYVGEERAEHEYPVASFMKAGCIVSQASDFPVTNPARIMMSLHNMVNRANPMYDTTEPLNAEEAVSVEDALTIMTKNGALLCGLDSVTGSLKEGKRADFAILDKNLLTMEATQLYTSKVQHLFREGACIK